MGEQELSSQSERFGTYVSQVSHEKKPKSNSNNKNKITKKNNKQIKTNPFIKIHKNSLFYPMTQQKDSHKQKKTNTFT